MLYVESFITLLFYLILFCSSNILSHYYLLYYLITNYQPTCYTSRYRNINIKPILVRHIVIEHDVVAIITNVSKDPIFVVNILFSLFFFCDFLFFLKYVIDCLLLFIKLLKISTTFKFFFNLCFESLISGGEDGYTLGVFFHLDGVKSPT